MSDWIYRLGILESTDKYSGLIIKITEFDRDKIYSSFRFYTLYFKDNNYQIYKSTKSGIPYKGTVSNTRRYHSRRTPTHSPLYEIKNIFSDTLLNQLISSEVKVLQVENYKLEFIKIIKNISDPYKYTKIKSQEELKSELRRKINCKDRRVSYFNNKLNEATRELYELECKLRLLESN